MSQPLPPARCCPGCSQAKHDPWHCTLYLLAHLFGTITTVQASPPMVLVWLSPLRELGLFRLHILSLQQLFGEPATFNRKQFCKERHVSHAILYLLRAEKCIQILFFDDIHTRKSWKQIECLCLTVSCIIGCGVRWFVVMASLKV